MGLGSNMGASTPFILAYWTAAKLSCHSHKKTVRTGNSMHFQLSKMPPSFVSRVHWNSNQNAMQRAKVSGLSTKEVPMHFLHNKTLPFVNWQNSCF